MVFYLSYLHVRSLPSIAPSQPKGFFHQITSLGRHRSLNSLALAQHPQP